MGEAKALARQGLSRLLRPAQVRLVRRMSVVLYVLGIASVVGGLVSIVLGIPVKEFSFGDTLIGSGVSALIGGLVLIGLGAAVAQLQRIAEFLGARPLARAGQVEPAVRIGNGPGRVPFPPKPKTEPR